MNFKKSAWKILRIDIIKFENFSSDNISLDENSYENILV